MNGGKSMKIGYIRVSTEDQNEDRQDMLLKPYNLNLIFREKVSGKDMNRKELQAMKALISRNKDDGEIDTVYVTEIARLARSTADLYKLVEFFEEHNTNLVSVNEKMVDTTTPQGKAFFGFIAIMAEFERELIRSRQRDGIAAAKAAGKHLGRPFRKYDKDEFDKLFKQYQDRLVTITEMGKKLGLSRATVYRLIADKKEELKKEI